MKKTVIITLFSVVTVACGILLVLNLPTSAAEKEATELGARIFELRTYTAHPGKLDELHARFRDHTCHLFVKYGMTLVGFWTPAEDDGKDNTLVYLLAHKDRDAARKSFQAFGGDPAWQEAFKDSRADGPLVQNVESRFLNPTDYSPLR